nr:hypothetical protein CFP56_20947 [Quercus suber]
MSDTEPTEALPASQSHPTHGGKGIEALNRPRYKSWRKKYRKMRVAFDAALEDNKRLFKEGDKLEAIAKRLKEELDGLLEICLDINQNPSVSPDLRFDVSWPDRKMQPGVDFIPANIAPEQAHNLLDDYRNYVSQGRIPVLDLHVIRNEVEQRLAAQEVTSLSALESSTSHTIPPASHADLPEDMQGDPPAGFLTTEQEAEYLLRLDAKLGDATAIRTTVEKEAVAAGLPGANGNKPEDRHLCEMAPREMDRQIEILNPQSQHNWLRTHHKTHLVEGVADDAESILSHDTPAKVPRKRGGAKGANLARRVGDRAVERAREGLSPSNMSMDDDELGLGFMDEGVGGGSGRKKAKDVGDSAYRAKGGKTGGSGKGKRKRASGGETPTGNGSAKKARVVELAGVSGGELASRD